MASYLEIAQEIAREAGALLKEYYLRRVDFRLKAEFDLVTEADIASEKLIVERLRRELPDHAVVAEEGGARQGASEYRWYIDPLDGTTNFAHSFPVFCVSMGLERAGELIAGVIFDPLRGEMFTTERGSGAFLDGERIHVSQVSRLTESLTATGFPNSKRSKNINVHFYHQLAMTTHGVRRAGAAALDLAYVACGRLDSFWEFSLKPWDMAAGVLMVTEAGGARSDMHGGPHGLHSPHLLVDNGLIHAEMLQLIGEIFAGRYRVPLPVVSA